MFFQAISKLNEENILQFSFSEHARIVAKNKDLHISEPTSGCSRSELVKVRCGANLTMMYSHVLRSGPASGLTQMALITDFLQPLLALSIKTVLLVRGTLHIRILQVLLVGCGGCSYLQHCHLRLNNLYFVDRT